MIQLVALDLDGTLVNEALTISQRTRTTIQRLIASGEVRVVVATGRMYPSACIFAEQLGIREPIIAYQGAMIRDLPTHYHHTVEEIGSAPLPVAPSQVPQPPFHPPLLHEPICSNVSRQLLDYLYTVPDCHINVYVDDVVYTSNEEFSVFYAQKAGVTPVVHNALHQVFNGTGPTKIMVSDEDGSVTDVLLNELQTRFSPDDISLCKSRYNFCEINHPRASKWNAIKHLAQGWGIADENILAIGDQGNDLSMIEGAGIGVAMGNATDAIKARADYVTDTVDNDGAVKAIERFVLQEVT